MITVFGSINMDLIATSERLPQPGETVAGKTFSTAAGGKGANQALAATRAGAKVRMAGAVGRDGFADDALALLAEAGTDLSLVKKVDKPTGTALILVSADGENMIVVVPGANGDVNGDDAEKAIGKLGHDDILMLQLEVPTEAIDKALRLARDKGIKTILNIAPLTPDAARLARLADIVVANETEFERLAARSGMSAEERRHELLRVHRETRQIVVVTLGADGVIAAKDGDLVAVPGLEIVPVDTVGAGDTFCGYLAAAVDQGLEFKTALRRAAVAGSLACLKPGAQPAIPTSDDVAARL
ncbi:ribokinase [Ciceribacter sp. L1K23]|uniref:ribokinase n=1 Tax=Ciceribacter sp. L1K23 TaxID=2820276 RepID=UPI001B819C08|nr:ribokinase [Ciceribacter sp. L1K23]MBR0557169.1 ribokinase [Ciceribacter sp. L1K23]